jgi:thermitase
MKDRKFTIEAVLSLLTAIVLVTFGLYGPALAAQPMKFTPDQVLVSFHPGTPGHVIAAVHASVGGTVQKSIDGLGVQVVEVPKGTVLERVAAYQKNPNVSYAQPNYIRPLITPIEGSFAPNLDVFDEQWNLHNVGQALQTYTDPNTGGLIWPEIRTDADIDMVEAWDVTQGSPDVLVAVLDSGVDCDHPDLDSKCVDNEDYVSISYNSYGEPIPEFTDVVGHGTHVAGIIAMETNNRGGGAGIGWATRFGSFKVCYAETIFGIVIGSNCLDSDIVDGINRVIELGTYHVMNMSFGGGPSPAVESAITNAFNRGIVPVAAAGNAGTWLRVYPAAYDNVVSVGSVSPVDDRSSFSSFSTVEDPWVDLLAPGDPILSTVPGIFCGAAGSDCFQWLQGTSMAAPHVSGVAALVWSQLLEDDPSNSNALTNRDEVIRRLRDCADQTGAMGQNMLIWSQYGRLNAYGAVTCAGTPTPPSPPSGAHIASLEGSSVVNGPTWTATVTITLHDADHALLANELVTGQWETAGGLIVDSCTTEGDGGCSVSLEGIGRSEKSTLFSVTSHPAGEGPDSISVSKP